MATAGQGMPSTSGQGEAQTSTASLKDVTASKDELLQRVDGLKQDLQEWRVRLNGQVQSYQEEIGGLRTKLAGEMEALKQEFTDLRAHLQRQMEATWTAVGRAPEPRGSPSPAAQAQQQEGALEQDADA